MEKMVGNRFLTCSKIVTMRLRIVNRVWKRCDFYKTNFSIHYCSKYVRTVIGDFLDCCRVVDGLSVVHLYVLTCDRIRLHLRRSPGVLLQLETISTEFGCLRTKSNDVQSISVALPSILRVWRLIGTDPGIYKTDGNRSRCRQYIFNRFERVRVRKNENKNVFQRTLRNRLFCKISAKRRSRTVVFTNS